MSEKISAKLRWFAGAPECPCYEAADALEAQDARIAELEAQIKTVLDRESATYARHDERVAKLEAATDSLEKMRGQVAHFEDGDFLDVGVGDRQRIVRDLPARPCALLLDMKTREIVGLRIYGARAALGGKSDE